MTRSHPPITAGYGEAVDQKSPLPTVGEAEPVAWRYAHVNTPTDWRVTDHDIGKDWPNLIVQPLYAAPPAPEGMREAADAVDQHMSAYIAGDGNERNARKAQQRLRAALTKERPNG